MTRGRMAEQLGSKKAKRLYRSGETTNAASRQNFIHDGDIHVALPVACMCVTRNAEPSTN
jgi:hypothetical protein